MLPPVSHASATKISRTPLSFRPSKRPRATASVVPRSPTLRIGKIDEPVSREARVQREPLELVAVRDALGRPHGLGDRACRFESGARGRCARRRASSDRSGRSAMLHGWTRPVATVTTRTCPPCTSTTAAAGIAGLPGRCRLSLDTRASRRRSRCARERNDDAAWRLAPARSRPATLEIMTAETARNVCRGSGRNPGRHADGRCRGSMSVAPAADVAPASIATALRGAGPAPHRQTTVLSDVTYG